MRTSMRRHATRAERVRLKHEIKVAREGLELLERRRDSLMAEGLSQLARAKQQRLQVTQKWQPLAGNWRDCLEHQDPQLLKKLAQTLELAPPLSGRSRRWMSVELADYACQRPQLELLGSVTEVDIRPERVRGALADLLPELIQLMNTETNIRRISIALKRCQRQVNALTEVVIPELSQERIRVEQRLEEKEREAIFQVKLLKARQR
jgi:V/A-type H+-transporting ATPase subunit D